MLAFDMHNAGDDLAIAQAEIGRRVRLPGARARTETRLWRFSGAVVLLRATKRIIASLASL